jgi:hypothetical protein
MSIGAMLLVGLAGVIADIHWRWTFLLYLLGWLLLLPVNVQRGHLLATQKSNGESVA